MPYFKLSLFLFGLTTFFSFTSSSNVNFSVWFAWISLFGFNSSLSNSIVSSKKIFLLPFFHLLFYHCIKCLSLIQQCTLCILSSIFNHNSFQSILIINHCITIKSRKMIIHLVCNCFYYINKFCITFTLAVIWIFKLWIEPSLYFP